MLNIYIKYKQRGLQFYKKKFTEEKKKTVKETLNDFLNNISKKQKNKRNFFF